jgi:transposase
VGRSRGGLTTKIHLAVDGRGRPLRLVLTGSQHNDITQAPALLAGFRPAFVLADRGYNSRTLVASFEANGAIAVITPRTCQQPRSFDTARYRVRNRIERCFGRLKQDRRIATRYDCNAANFMAFLCLATLPLWVV